MEDPCILFFRCWPGFDPDSDFPFQKYNALPEETILNELEADSRRCLESKAGQGEVKRRWDELKQELQKQKGRILARPGAPRPAPRAEFRPWFAGIEARSGADFVRHVGRLSGWVRQHIDEAWVATCRQYVARVEGAEQAERAVQDLQREFRGGTLSDLDLPLVPVFGWIPERDLARVDLARLLDTESLSSQETGRDLEELCRWVVLRDVRASKLMDLVKHETRIAQEKEMPPAASNAPAADATQTPEPARPKRRRIPDRSILEPKIRDHLNRDPYATCEAVAEAVGCGVGTVAESDWWKANRRRLAVCRQNNAEPKAVPLDEQWMNEAGAGKQTQLHRHRDQMAVLDDQIDAREAELHRRIGEYQKEHPTETPQQIARACGCTAADVERRQAMLRELIAQQAESAKEDTDEPDPDTKRGTRRHWVKKRV